MGLSAGGVLLFIVRSSAPNEPSTRSNQLAFGGPVALSSLANIGSANRRGVTTDRNSQPHEVAAVASFYASWPGRLSAHFAVFLGKLGRSMQLA